MKSVIRVSNLGKKYFLKGGDRSTPGLRHILQGKIESLWKTKKPEGERKEFWALKNVDFQVAEGEIVGIVGRNGSGKSTLLKILSRITEPTEGKVHITGRVASLLEVGTGFHPDLTGRENIFLNGSILGMKKGEVERLLDEIIDFAEVKDFIDVPVKRYSSGMYVKLAFSVAAHLNPEILFVDEVLAVGDQQFQKKCLGKMREVASSQGRTVLFVSHNLSVVSSLCNKGIFLQEGELKFFGAVQETIDRYLVANQPSFIPLKDIRRTEGNGELRFTGFETKNKNGETIDSLCSGQEVDFVFEYEIPNLKSISGVIIYFCVKSTMDVPLFHQNNLLDVGSFNLNGGKGKMTCKIKKWPLPASLCSLTVWATKGDQALDVIHYAAEIHTIAGNFHPSGEIPTVRDGVLLVEGQWSAQSDKP